MILVKKFQTPNNLLNLLLLGDTGTEYNIHQTQFISSKQIRKRCRVTKYTHSLVQVAEGCFTNQYFKSKTRSRISMYQDAKFVPYGHLLIDLTPKTVDSHLGIALIVAQFQQNFIYQLE